MVAGLPKDPIERTRSIASLYVSVCHASQRGVLRQTRSPNPHTDARFGTAIGGFSLRGEARSIGI